MGTSASKGKKQRKANETLHKAVQAFNQGDNRTAVELCITALEYDEENAYAYHIKGMAYSAMQKYDTAVKHFDKALKCDKNLKQTYLNKGVALHAQQEFRRALSCCSHAIELDPEYKNAYNLKGATHHERQEYSKAIECYEEALTIDPEYETAKKNKEASETALWEGETSERTSLDEARSNVYSSFVVFPGANSRNGKSEHPNKGRYSTRSHASSATERWRKYHGNKREGMSKRNGSQRITSNRQGSRGPESMKTRSLSSMSRRYDNVSAGRSTKQGHRKNTGREYSRRGKQLGARSTDNLVESERGGSKRAGNKQSAARSSRQVVESSQPFYTLDEVDENVSMQSGQDSTIASTLYGFEEGNDVDSQDALEEPQNLNGSPNRSLRLVAGRHRTNEARSETDRKHSLRGSKYDATRATPANVREDARQKRNLGRSKDARGSNSKGTTSGGWRPMGTIVRNSLLECP
eukprot:gb/GECG01010133.1/.p1 GENE.gb/GECG01010133.1/~~gb/GECG01010133.1/.p1  ORF type:complete len:466 (+),score=62.66 gb/GECG01010133.1/:1-1398(+)